MVPLDIYYIYIGSCVIGIVYTYIDIQALKDLPYDLLLYSGV